MVPSNRGDMPAQFVRYRVGQLLYQGPDVKGNGCKVGGFVLSYSGEISHYASNTMDVQ